jgi:DNA-binding response OmpR family regulator
MMAHVLRRVGHSVVEACDGKVGLDIFRQANADLVITDMVMPEKEGFEVLIELRKRQPSLKVIAMSGGGLQKPTDNLRMARHLGAKVLLKPFSTAVLISTVNEMLPGALQEQKPAAL